MKAAEYQYQQLLRHATNLYNSEKEVSGIFEALRVNISDVTLKDAINREAEENYKHCARLEGLLEILNRNPQRSCASEDAWSNFTQQFSNTLKRIATKHAEFGYHTAIYAALALGQNEIATLLKCCLSSGSLHTNPTTNQGKNQPSHQMDHNCLARTAA